MKVDIWANVRMPPIRRGRGSIKRGKDNVSGIIKFNPVIDQSMNQGSNCMIVKATGDMMWKATLSIALGKICLNSHFQ